MFHQRLLKLVHFKLHRNVYLETKKSENESASINATVSKKIHLKLLAPPISIEYIKKHPALCEHHSVPVRRGVVNKKIVSRTTTTQSLCILIWSNCINFFKDWRKVKLKESWKNIDKKIAIVVLYDMRSLACSELYFLCENPISDKLWWI